MVFRLSALDFYFQGSQWYRSRILGGTVELFQDEFLQWEDKFKVRGVRGTRGRGVIWQRCPTHNLRGNLETFLRRLETATYGVLLALSRFFPAQKQSIWIYRTFGIHVGTKQPLGVPLWTDVYHVFLHYKKQMWLIHLKPSRVKGWTTPSTLHRLSIIH